MSPTILIAALLSATTATNDGSLLVLRGTSKPVTLATGSDITHVAMIFAHGDEDWVYEATPAKVRRLTMAAYLRELGTSNHGKRKPTTISMLRPKQPYSEAQLRLMQEYAQAQIGRRYSVKGYLRSQEFAGMHCAHFAAATLEAGGRFNFDQEFSITPGDLVSNIAKSHQPPVSIAVQPIASSDSWCAQSWNTWFNYSAWCQWACYETWTFCW